MSAYDKGANIRSIFSEVDKCFDDYEKQFHRSKIHRDNFIRFVVRTTGITDLFFIADSENEPYIIIRPYWDGYWYRVYSSPFAKIADEKDMLRIASLHEVVLCAVRVLHITLGLRNSGCCLVSGEDSSQGTNRFLDNLDTYAKKFEFIEDDMSPERLSLHQAYSLIQFALGSKHYLSEEYRKQREEVDWEPQKITMFLCYYTEYMAWLLFLIGKIQILRIANINRRFRIPLKTLSSKESLGFELLGKTRFCRVEANYSAKSEYGAAHRFWRLKQSAIPRP